ncbi:MAG TPA: hypothetical protein VET85_16705 [Stellaceae bacterium]|nr:hypothetical protein [Stellaceae bacterium]
MNPDTDTWRITTRLLTQHGVDAAKVVAQRAEELKAKGDEQGVRALMKIATAMAELLRREPTEDERVH